MSDRTQLLLPTTDRGENFPDQTSQSPDSPARHSDSSRSTQLSTLHLPTSTDDQPHAKSDMMAQLDTGHDGRNEELPREPKAEKAGTNREEPPRPGPGPPRVAPKSGKKLDGKRDTKPEKPEMKSTSKQVSTSKTGANQNKQGSKLDRKTEEKQASKAEPKQTSKQVPGPTSITSTTNESITNQEDVNGGKETAAPVECPEVGNSGGAEPIELESNQKCPAPQAGQTSNSMQVGLLQVPMSTTTGETATLSPSIESALTLAVPDIVLGTQTAIEATAPASKENKAELSETPKSGDGAQKQEASSEKANTIPVSIPGTSEAQTVQNPPDNSSAATLIVPSTLKDSDGHTLGPLSPTLALPSLAATPAATPLSPARSKASAAGSTSGPQLHAPSVASHTRKGSGLSRSPSARPRPAGGAGAPGAPRKVDSLTVAKVVADHSKEHKGGPTAGSVLRVPSARVDRGPAGIKTPVALPRSPSANNTNAAGRLKASGSKQAPPHPSTLEIKLELTNETTGASTPAPFSGHRRSIARAGSRASLSTSAAIGSADSPMHATVQVEGDKGHSAVEDLDDDEDPELAAAIAAYTTESWSYRAIPYTPIWCAAFCCALNVLLPGFGTILVGLLGVCFGQSRWSSDGTANIEKSGVTVATSGPSGKGGQKIGVGNQIDIKLDNGKKREKRSGAETALITIGANLFVGISQLFTVTFLLVGWFWSIAWGVHMLSLASNALNLFKNSLI